MLIKFEAKLVIPHTENAPDNYDASTGLSPQDNFVVSRRFDNGVAVSKYGDLIWDISTWEPEGRLSRLCFDFWKDGALTLPREQLSKDARWILFSLMWLRKGTPFKVLTLQNYMGVIRALAHYAEEISCSMPGLLSDEKLLLAFVKTRCTGSQSKLLCSLISHLSRIGNELLGFSVVGGKTHKLLKSIVAAYKSGLQQHPPIPTRIYSAILSNLDEELLAWERVAPECLMLIRKCGKDSFYGRRIGAQKSKAKRLGLDLERRPVWDDVASRELREYLRAKGHLDSVVGLGSAVNELQVVAKLIIQAFSGMREDEATTLPYDCLVTTMSGGRTHRLIQGCTTKLSKRAKRTRWVTNQEGHRAIEVAQKIAAAIYAACDATIVLKKKSNAKGNGCPLFVSIAYLALGGAHSPGTLKEGHFFPGELSLISCVQLRQRIQPTIEEADLVELEKIDEHRAWRSQNKFQVGRSWTLATHQLRRSLALYAQCSGLVTLPSLRRQLQHITDEMARYYSRGSQYAKDIFGAAQPEKDHFIVDWQAAQVESEAISYAMHVLLAEDTLTGGHAAFVTHRLRGGDGIVAAKTRAETERMFKKGQLHFRETVMGGCTRSDECDRPALDWLNVDCIRKNCSDLVINLTKLEEVVVEQERFLQSISPASLLYRTENANLAVLRSALEKALLDKRGEPR